MASSLPFPLPEHGVVLAEVRTVRRAGVVRLRGLDTPQLTGIAAEVRCGARVLDGASDADGATSSYGVEELLRAAVRGLGGGNLQTAAAYSLGLAQGTRDWPAADRRRRAAQVYGVSVERFRKHHELMVLGQVTEQLLALATRARDEPPAPTPPAHRPAVRLPAAHRTLDARTGERTVPVTLHVHSVDLLRDVDVVLSPANTYFALPAPYKSSVAASLRRAAARRGPTGNLMEDHLYEELRGWSSQFGAPGLAALPGTVAATSAGELRAQGIRRVYHVAMATPRPGTNDYDVQPADVTRGVARAFALLREEGDLFDPPLASVCLPLFGAGRGGLSPLDSFGALWTAVEAELARGALWDIHVVVRRQDRADLIEQLLAARASGTRTAAWAARCGDGESS